MLRPTAWVSYAVPAGNYFILTWMEDAERAAAKVNSRKDEDDSLACIVDLTQEWTPRRRITAGNAARGEGERMSRDTIRLPHDAYRLLQTLRAAGHSAYVVGGCVREDSLLGRLPGDWDICTSARPDEMKALFCSQRLIPDRRKARHGGRHSARKAV